MFDLDLTDTEAEFFAKGHEYEAGIPESFADMDVGFEKPSFWDRVLGRVDDER